MQPTISIITVCYNAEQLIERTIKSIAEQTYKNIEYVIIDGASKDNTLTIADNYASKFNKMIIVSEPDKGIYDAMNKGLQKATGEYVWFMNAGDCIYEPTTLEHIISKNHPDVIYGDTMIVDESGKELGLRRLRPPKKLTWKSFRKGMLVCHQSILVKRSIAPDYDLQYKMVADIDWVIRVLKAAKTIKNTHRILSRFLEGGFSKQNERKSWTDRYDVMVNHYGYLQTWLFHIWIVIRRMVKKSNERKFLTE